MIRSMTAFARLERGYESGSLVWEMRSVNHRYLEVSFRLPDSLREIEFPLRDLVRAKLGRGKVDCALRISAATTSSHLEIDRPVLLHLLATLEQLRRDAPEVASPDPLALLAWPGVLAEPEDDVESLKHAALESFGAGLDALEAQRAREGEALARVIRDRLGQIDVLVAAVTAATKGIGPAVKARLLARVNELAVDLDGPRLEQEVALLVQRADVAEELDRLRIHVASVRSDLASNEPVGRRLDFLMQELNREANTLASKAMLPEVTRHAVDLKVVIEQIREQVQNVE
jgi:uncharacterized protein (TIGR00255 family)